MCDLIGLHVHSLIYQCEYPVSRPRMLRYRYVWTVEVTADVKGLFYSPLLSGHASRPGAFFDFPQPISLCIPHVLASMDVRPLSHSSLRKPKAYVLTLGHTSMVVFEP